MNAPTLEREELALTWWRSMPARPALFVAWEVSTLAAFVLASGSAIPATDSFLAQPQWLILAAAAPCSPPTSHCRTFYPLTVILAEFICGLADLT